MGQSVITLGEILGISNASRSKNEFKLNLRRKLAREMSYNIWGQNVKFISTNPDLEHKFSEFNNMNELIQVMSWNEYCLSLSGRSIVTLNKTKTGKFMLSIPNIYFLQGLSKSFVTPQAAVVYQRVTLDDRLIIIKSTYTTTYCQNELWGMNDNKVFTFGVQSKIWQDLQIEPYWEHNLGFVPVVEFMNIARPYSYWLNTNWDELTDWSYGASYEDTIWEALKNLRKELVMCHSRVLVEDTNQQVINTLQKNLDEMDDRYEDYLGDYIINTGIGNKATPIPGVGDFNKYSKVILDLLDMYFKFCGSSRFSEGGGAQKTVGEVGAQFRNKNEFLEYKINLRIQKMTELVYKYFRCCGVDEKTARDFVINIVPNILKDDVTYIETQTALIQNHIISPIDWIKDYYNCSTQQAQAIFDKNKKMNDELQQDQMEKMLQHTKSIDSLGNHNNSMGDRFK